MTQEVEAGSLGAYHLAYIYHELGDLDNMAKWFRLRPPDLDPLNLHLIRTMAGTIATHWDPAIRAILDHPEHKAYFDARLARLR